jgi:hypothetical protein
MSAKLLDIIARQPTTKTMNRMTEQIAQMVTPVKTTAWGGLYNSLALVLDDADYALITKNVIKTADALIKLVSINPKIDNKLSPYNILTLQDKWKTLQKEFDLQEAVISIGVQRIIECVEEQYVEEFKEDYFGYANQTIKTLLDHLHTKWCKVMTKNGPMQLMLSIRCGSPQLPTSSPLDGSCPSNRKNARQSMPSSPRRPKYSTLLARCTRATTSLRSK